MKQTFLLTSKQFVFIVLLIVANLAFSQSKDIPSGYYDDANGLSGYTLKSALHNIIDDHTVRSYSQLWTDMQSTDNDGVYEDDNSVLDMYSENPDGPDPYNYTWVTNQCGNYSAENYCYNREHSFPKSWFNDASPMYTDLYHLYPTDGYVNGRRSNWPFGENNGEDYTSQNGSKVGNCTYPGYSGTVFEPIDEFKGDFARTYFYMATRYEDVLTGWSSTVLDGSSDQVYVDWYLDMMIEWHNNDPVSQKEINRNDAVYGIQGNRNPFIDHPEYVAAIWGGNAPTSFSNIATNPAEPEDTDVVNVSANITDADGISTVTLNWGTVSGSLTNDIAMTNTGGSVYQTSSAIPAQTDGTTVYYKITVVDDAAMSSSSSTKSYHIGEIPVELTLLEEDFETTEDDIVVDLVGWENYNEVGSVQWEGRDYSSNKYAQAASFQSGEQNVIWLITPQVNLDQSVDEVFSFDINTAYWTHHGFSVLISQNFDGTNVTSASWQDVTSNFTIPTTPTSGYGTIGPAGSMSLNSYSGTIHIAFKYEGNDSGSTGETGTYQVDNVLIEGIENLDDNTAPILTFDPVNGATDVEIESSVVLTSTESLLTNAGAAIDASYLQSVITFKVDNESGSDVAFSASIDANKKEITITPSSDLDYETDYFVSVAANAFEDTAANETVVQNIIFTTEITPDETAPVLTITPENESTNIALDATITVNSTESLLTNSGGVIDASYLQSVIQFKKENSSGAAVDFTAEIDVDKKVISINPDSDLEGLTNYYVAVVENAFEDTSANQTAALSVIFTTQITPDTDAPVLTFEPQNGDSNIELDAQVIISSNEALLTNTGAAIDETYLASVIAFKTEDTNGEAVAFSAEIDSENKQISITPTALFANETQYYVAIAESAFEDTAANETASGAINFTTKPAVDEIAPELTILPENESENIAIDAQIQISSNEALYSNTGGEINESYIISQVELKSGSIDGQNITYSASIDSDEKLITIVPDTYLSNATSYFVVVAANAFEDAAGNETEATSTSFTTELQLDTDAPVLTFEPQNGDSNIELDAQVIISSNEALLTNTGDAINETYLTSVITFKTENANGEAVAFSAEIDSENKQISITPTALFANEMQYYVAIAESAFEDAAANETASGAINFTTKPAVDEVAPELTILPENESENIAIDVQIQISSNEALYSNTGGEVNESYIISQVEMKSGSIDGQNVGYSASISSNNKLITIIPDENLSYETTYFVVVAANAFEDAAGNETVATSSSFTTGIQPDTEPPVLTIIPENDSVGAEITTSVIINSNEPLFTENGGVITNTYLQNNIQFLKDSLAGSSVDYSVSINSDKTQITISPYNYLSYSTAYHVTIPEHTFADENANKTDVFASSFTTQAVPDFDAPVFTNGYPNIVNLSTNGFTCEFSLNEPGKVYYKTLPADNAEPTIQHVLNGDFEEIIEANTVYQVSIDNLDPNTAYKVYMLTQDNHANQNTSSSFVIAELSTLGIAPEITQQPTDATICAGENLELSLSANGTEDLSYQWYFNNSTLDNQISATLEIENTTIEQSGNYHCVVSNTWGSQSSDTVAVTIQSLVNAGDDYTINAKSTQTYLNIFDSIPGNPTPGGTWIEINDNNGAFEDGIFNPSVSGIGEFVVNYEVDGNCNYDEAVITIVVEDGNSIYSESNFNLEIYPNPTNGIVNLNYDNLIAGKIQIFALDGTLKIETELTEKIDLSELNSGLYLIKIIAESKFEIYQIQKL